jgi:hypothetical protein
MGHVGWAAQASVCGAPRTSPEMESEKFVVKRGPQEAWPNLHSALRVQFVVGLGLARFRVAGGRVECARCMHRLG